MADILRFPARLRQVAPSTEMSVEDAIMHISMVITGDGGETLVEDDALLAIIGHIEDLERQLGWHGDDTPPEAA